MISLKLYNTEHWIGILFKGGHKVVTDVTDYFGLIYFVPQGRPLNSADLFFIRRGHANLVWFNHSLFKPTYTLP